MVAVCPSYIWDARPLKVKMMVVNILGLSNQCVDKEIKCHIMQ